MKIQGHFLYSTLNDYDLKYRRARYIQVRDQLYDRLGTQGGKQKKSVCVKYIPKKGNRGDRRLIVSPTGKVIYYLSIGRLGNNDSLDGEAYRLCKPEKKDKFNKKTGYYEAWCKYTNTFLFAVKIIPLTIEEAANEYDESIGRTWKEIKILKQLVGLFRKNVSQNIPLYYINTICPDSRIEDYNNTNIINYFKDGEKVEKLAELIKEIGEIKDQLVGIKHYREIKDNIDAIYSHYLEEFLKNNTFKPEKQYSNKSVLIFNEISDFDVTHLLENYPEFVLRREYILPSIFQILYGIATVQKHLELVHFDLHLSNVLVTKILPNRFWHYRIDKTDYYIPNQGYLFKIWDFGRAHYLHTDDPNKIKKNILKQFNRFFKFNNNEFNKYLNNTFSKIAFRKYLYSFDVFRFFSAYYYKLTQSINEMSKDNVSSKKTQTTSSTQDPLNILNPRQINNLPEFEVIKKIIDYSVDDIIYNMVNPRIKKHEYNGHPQQLIKKFFKSYTTAPTDKLQIINFNKPFIL
jgi:hypothetical protein